MRSARESSLDDGVLGRARGERCGPRRGRVELRGNVSIFFLRTIGILMSEKVIKRLSYFNGSFPQVSLPGWPMAPSRGVPGGGCRKGGCRAGVEVGVGVCRGGAASASLLLGGVDRGLFPSRRVRARPCHAVRPLRLSGPAARRAGAAAAGGRLQRRIFEREQAAARVEL
jgi:hypothetical protein